MAVLLVAAALAAPRAAGASDSASLQFTVPAPDPAQAGDVVELQALAINTGNTVWSPGAYYWVGEIYDLEYHLLARTEQNSPRDAVAPGAVAAISLPFHIPDTMFGRKLYRIYLVKDTRTLIESEYKGFQVVEKPLPPPPEVVNYRLEGNITESYKNASHNKWGNHSGATTFNTVGKLKDSSYLVNLYILHTQGNAFDPFIVVANYYAPWGTIYGGDVSPILGALSINGQGLRGAMLEQKRGRYFWNVLGGQTVSSQPGTVTTNGRYARSIYGLRWGADVAESLKASFNYFLSGDETGSLSSDPNSAHFRGPSLVAQKNNGYGLDLTWEPRQKLKFLAAYQKNNYFADASKAGAADGAYKLEAGLERRLFRFKTYLQRAGGNYVAFGAPGVVGDRLTYDFNGSLYPASWYSLSLSGDQYRDNLANDPQKTTTTNRVVNVGNSLQLPTATSLNLNASLNTAVGKPLTALNNQTTTLGLGLSQPVKAHSVSLNVQNSQFRDKNKLAHDLDTQTFGLSSNWRLPRNWSSTLGLTESVTADKADGSKRTSQSFGPSLSLPLKPKWTGQFWGTWTAVKNTSPSSPADAVTISFNSEYTWARSKQNLLTFGLGANDNKDKLNAANNLKEVTVSFRYSYSF